MLRSYKLVFCVCGNYIIIEKTSIALQYSSCASLINTIILNVDPIAPMFIQMLGIFLSHLTSDRLHIQIYPSSTNLRPLD